MKVLELADMLGFEALAMPSPGEEVTGGYVGDLLSWVMSRAAAGQVWVTIMTNINIVAVGLLTGVSAVVIAEGCPVPDDVIKKAREEGVNILRSNMSAFAAVAAVSRALCL